MSQRLSAALTDLRAANDALLGEMERERELERQRSAFFAAASHELKTPVTILKGQLTGMLDEVGVYRDRDRYLARSLQVTSRMEALVGEILTISRMESGTGLPEGRGGPLPACGGTAGAGQGAAGSAGDGPLPVPGPRPRPPGRSQPAGTGRWTNLLSNAALYSPAGARIRVRTLRLDGRPTLVVENTGVQIGAEALPACLSPSTGRSSPEPTHRRQRSGALPGEDDPGSGTGPGARSRISPTACGPV